jgi:hypothetical protein
MHKLLVDYAQAVVSVYRNKIIECLTQYKVAAKLIRLIGLTLINTGARVMINNEYTKEFKIEARGKQGERLSATLFSSVVDIILKQRDLGGNISTRLKQCSVYADDILIVTRTKQSLIDTFQELKISHYILD